MTWEKIVLKNLHSTIGGLWLVAPEGKSPWLTVTPLRITMSPITLLTVTPRKKSPNEMNKQPL